MPRQKSKLLSNASQYGYTRFFLLFSMAELVLIILINVFTDLSDRTTLDLVSVAMDTFSQGIGTILLYSCFAERYLKNQGSYTFSELLFWTNFQFLTNIIFTTSNGKMERTILLFYDEQVSLMVSVVMLVVFQRFVFQIGGRELKKSALIVKSLAAVSALLVLGNVFGHFISYVDEAGFHHRGSAYSLWLIVTGLIGVIIMVNICVQNTSMADKIAFIQFLILPYIGNALYSYLHFPFIQYQCVLAALLLIFVKIFVSRAYRLAEQTEINMKQQMQLMTSQIQPHFIFNALSSIRQISKDKETADLILDFSNYLRMNLETLSYDACVHFEKELEHTKQYLRIEQLRFGERLAVSYDLQCMDFEIPPLTLQPIVENAIKHGILERIYGGTVRITSVREENHIVITVADDGVGFDPEHKKEDGRVHIGIENVRARLERMVGGSLVIDSEVGKGTTIQILIPCTYGKV